VHVNVHVHVHGNANRLLSNIFKCLNSSGWNKFQYNIKTEADDDVEIMPTVSAGIRYVSESRWFFDAGARFDYHISN